MCNLVTLSDGFFSQKANKLFINAGALSVTGKFAKHPETPSRSYCCLRSILYSCIWPRMFYWSSE